MVAQVAMEFAKLDRIDIPTSLAKLARRDDGLQHLNADDRRLRNGYR